MTATDTPSGKPLLMLISIDGMRPDAVLDAARHGLKVPNLRAFVADGAYATGVHGVLPTLTYPSHMTLMTGTSPAKHGIYANTTFDPFGRNEHGWYWYAEDARVATLWDRGRRGALEDGQCVLAHQRRRSHHLQSAADLALRHRRRSEIAACVEHARIGDRSCRRRWGGIQAAWTRT